MPKLIEKRLIQIEWADIEGRTKHRKPKSASIRSSGHHLMQVVRYALQTSGLLKTYTADADEELMPLRMAMGMAWEDWCVGLWPDLVWQPGEVELDGVFMTPDGITEIDNAVIDPALKKFAFSPYPTMCVEEFKLTWKSSRRGESITDEKLWMWQLAGLCKGMNVNYARLHVNYVMGDYKGSGPQYFTYLLHFPQDELDKFWKNIILANRDKSPKEEH